jgi:hypothetical protein
MILRFALNTLTLLWYGAIAALIYTGWLLRDQRYLVPESGIGYWLGILGSSMMLLLLIYPVRKKRPRWVYAGSINFWFRLHMFLGMVGPVLVIFHSGYKLGSLNGSVAFICMLVVAGSGLIGRYLYRRSHHGLYGEKIRFEELYHQNKNWDQQLIVLRQKRPDIVDELRAIEQKLVNRHTGLNRSFWFFKSTRWKLNGLKKKLRKAINRSEERKMLLNRMGSLQSICNLGVNEILFSYWHILHYPLFILLVFSGITHVAVVHFY